MRSLPLALALVWIPTATAGALHDEVLAQLGGIESPPTQQSLTALGPDVGAELLDLASSDELTPSKRARAVRALGWFPSPESRSFLTRALQGEDHLVRRKAAAALASGWGVGALPELRLALADEQDTQLRIATAKALGQLQHPDARAVLDARLELETTAAVRDAITLALSH